MSLKLGRFKALQNKSYSIVEKKNADYGDSVNQTYEKFGYVSLLVRMYDKLHRLETILEKGDIEVSDETIQDTLIDLSNYALLAIIELEECKE